MCIRDSNRSKVLHCRMNVFLNSVIPYSCRFFFSAVWIFRIHIAFHTSGRWCSVWLIGVFRIKHIIIITACKAPCMTSHSSAVACPSCITFNSSKTVTAYRNNYSGMSLTQKYISCVRCICTICNLMFWMKSAVSSCPINTVRAVWVIRNYTCRNTALSYNCLLYTSDAADEEDSVGLGGCRIIKKKNKKERRGSKER